MQKQENAKPPSDRVSQFAAQLLPNSIAIIVSNPERIRSNDTEHQYRQSSDLLYLTGFPEPQSAFVVTNFGGKLRRLMFVLPKNPAHEVWTGIRIGVEKAKEEYKLNSAHVIDDFASVLSHLLVEADHVYYRFGVNEQLDEKFRFVWKGEQKPLLNPETILHEMRLIKSPAEVDLIRKASRISATAHCATMRRCNPGLFEYQLQATMEHVFTDCGAPSPAYGSIVASGNNACVLHYMNNSSQIKDGDLVLIDAACEYNGYASDITRTIPANGRFTEPQRELYELVLKAQLAAIDKVKPGETLDSVHAAAAAVLRRGLVKLGILPPEMASVKRAKKIIAAARKEGKLSDLVTLSRFFMHGTSHYMGLDVHDVSSRYEPGSRRRKPRKLQAGMVFTVEPGLYFNLNDEKVPEKYRGIGIRIEDDVLVTADGVEVLTTAAPKSVIDIETIMSD